VYVRSNVILIHDVSYFNIVIVYRVNKLNIWAHIRRRCMYYIWESSSFDWQQWYRNECV